MIARLAFYPLVDPNGRTATIRATAALIAFALGVRYTAVFAPAALALATVGVSVLALVVLSGVLSQVLCAHDRVESLSVRSSLRSGVGLLALALVMLAPAVLLLASTVVDAIAEPPDGGARGVLLLIGSTASMVFFLACAYVYPVLASASATAGSIRAAFDRDVVVPVLLDLSYLSRWTVALALSIPAMGLLVATIRSGGPTGLLAAVFAAVLTVASTRVIGDGFETALGVDPRE